MSEKDEERMVLETRLKVEGTVDRQVYLDFKRIIEIEREKATDEDRPEPSVSQVLETVLRKGIKKYKKDRNVVF